MYSLVSAKLKRRGQGARYEDIDISYMRLRDILKTYNHGFIKLTNPSLSGPVWLSLDSLRTDPVNLRVNQYFSDWLAGLGTLSLPTTNIEPTYTETHVLYSDAIRARYTMQRVHPIAPPSNPFPIEELKDVLITKTGVLHTDFYQYMMVSINGLFHMLDLQPYGVKIKNAGVSGDVAGDTLVGLVSFKDVGALQYVPLSSAMIDVPSNMYQYKDTVWINTGIDLTNKTPILVLGGYLHVSDSVYTVINAAQGIIQVNLSKIQWLHRFMESRYLIDLSSLEITQLSNNPGRVALDELYSNVTVERFFDLSQTFMVVVDTPSLFTDTIRVADTKLPNAYVAYTPPIFPLRTRYGLMKEYWALKEDDQYSLIIDNNHVPNYVFETTYWKEMSSVDETLNWGNGVSVSLAELFKIGSETYA